jgi:hypothetical protein
MSDTTASTEAEYVGRHRPSGFQHLAMVGKSAGLEADARRGRYHYFPRHNADFRGESR